MAYIELC